MLDRRTLLARGAALGTAAALPGHALAAMPSTAKAAPSAHRFKIGSIDVIALHDGVVQFPMPKGFVRNASDAEVSAAYSELGMPGDKLTITFTALVANTGGKLVLFDTGFGDSGPPSAGAIQANLAAVGIQPSDIDTVVLSHLHVDHIAGLRNKAGQAVYPNAEVMIQEKEWAFWSDPANATDGTKDNFAAVVEKLGPVAKDINRFAWGKEILPGITAVQADGHTPGHTAFVIASGNDRMMYVADITNHPGVFARRPEWQAVFDMDPQLAIATRKRMLDMAAAEKLQLSFYHAPFPATGFAVRSGQGYDFAPALWKSAV
jgi:glyoxylase-like metal-dependent hydrolase (beta-lactamase superfamily II)